MARLVASALLLLLASATANADEGAAAAERLLELTRADQLAAPVYAQVRQMFAQRFAEANGSGQATLERYQAKADALLDRQIGWDRIKPDLVALYQQEFSRSELEQLVAFYQSDLGRKMLARLPELNMRSAALAQARLERAVPEVNELLERMSAELESKQP